MNNILLALALTNSLSFFDIVMQYSAGYCSAKDSTVKALRIHYYPEDNGGSVEVYCSNGRMKFKEFY